MTVIYSPTTETELAYLRALLDGEQIPYYIHNDYFGSMSVGPVIPLFNAKSIMVAREHAERALQLVNEYLELTSRVSSSWSQRLRNVLEVAVFGWFIPGRHDTRHNENGDSSPVT